MDYDDEAWDRSTEICDAWWKSLNLNQKEFLYDNVMLVKKHRQGIHQDLLTLKSGFYNTLLRVDFEDGGWALIRYPKPGRIAFPEEKVRNEVSVLRLLNDKTAIPVPFVYHSGPREEAPSEAGPYIIMDWIKHETNYGEVLEDPGLEPGTRQRLNPRFPRNELVSVYREMSKVLLEMSKFSFDKIGSVEETSDGEWNVTRRPLTMNMNELIRVARAPVDSPELPTTTFSSSTDYFVALADMHLLHLKYQKNSAVSSADDCRRKYVARKLFRKLAAEGRLTSHFCASPSEEEPKPFKLFCDDFRPGNVLVDAEHKISGVADWEFTYAAPAEFTYVPPWWILIETPDNWPDDLDSFTTVYNLILNYLFRGMGEAEDEMIEQGRLREEERLSVKMKECWENGLFWIVYAAKNSWAFDLIYWGKLDELFFGERGEGEKSWEERLELLGDGERDSMEKFVEEKMAHTIEEKAQVKDSGE